MFFSDESKQFSEDSVVAMTNVLKITNILLRRFIDSHDDKIQAVTLPFDCSVGAQASLEFAFLLRNRSNMTEAPEALIDGQ